MASQQISNHREDAEIYTGSSICKQKSQELLNRISLPKGLLPLNDLQEIGYNPNTGFVWIKQKKSSQHKFRLISKTVSYDTEITAFLEDRKMKRLTGVKSKELLIWVGISEISVHQQDAKKITFSTSSGLSRTFPILVNWIVQDLHIAGYPC